MARPSWPTLVARRFRVNATFIFRSNSPSKPNFLDHHAGLGVCPDAKLIRRRQPARPSYPPGAFQHGPGSAVAARNAARQEHLLQFLRLTAPPRPIRISRPPVPQDQRFAKQIRIENRVIPFSVAL